MIRRPPRSTLFPYTTLSDLTASGGPTPRARAPASAPGRGWAPPSVSGSPRRSEEHRSELQSPCHLVSPLLLEKKKKHSSSHHTKGHITLSGCAQTVARALRS